MRNWLLVLMSAAIAMVAPAALLAAPPAAHALSCPQLTAEEYVERADVVLVGRVDSGEPPDSPGPLDPDEAATAQLAVDRYLRGSGPEQISIKSIRLGWLGSWPERFIHRWGVFFLEADDNRYVEAGCPGSRFMEHPDYDEFLDEVIAITGPGVSPEEGAQLVEPTTDSASGVPDQEEEHSPEQASALWLLLIGGLAALLAAGTGAGAACVWRRAR